VVGEKTVLNPGREEAVGHKKKENKHQHDTSGAQTNLYKRGLAIALHAHHHQLGRAQAQLVVAAHGLQIGEQPKQLAVGRLPLLRSAYATS
jgi:hypothetical protein